MSDKETCCTCKYWELIGQEHNEEHVECAGYCHRYPQQPRMQGCSDWCAEYKKNDE